MSVETDQNRNVEDTLNRGGSSIDRIRKRSTHLLHTKTALRELQRDIHDMLEWPLKLVGFTIQIVWAMTIALFIGFLLGHLTGLPLWMTFIVGVGIAESPITYLTWKKIREEDSKAKIMTEAWENQYDTATLINEYKQICKRQAERHM